jgi:hypothetical protein
MVVSACLLAVEIAEIITALAGCFTLLLGLIKAFLAWWEKLTRKEDRAANAPVPAPPCDWLLTWAA